MEWLIDLTKGDGALFRYFEFNYEEVFDILHGFINFIEEDDADTGSRRGYGPGDLSRNVLKSLTGKEKLDDGFVSWMVENINRNSPNSLAFAYTEHVFDGKLIDGYLEKVSLISKEHISKLIVFLSVGKIPGGNGDTYITMYDRSS